MKRLTELYESEIVSKERYEKHSPCHMCPYQSTNECLKDMCTYVNVLNKLSAYEDTGLEPGEIKQLCTYPLTGCSDCNYTKLLSELNKLKAGGNK